jgi:hypothetical protein
LFKKWNKKKETEAEVEKKSLRDRLAESAALSESRESVRRMGMFLKHLEEIREAHRGGWSYKEIWRIMHRDGLVDFGCFSLINFAKPTALAKAGMAPPAKAGATRIGLPRFVQEAAPRNPKRF